MKIQRAKGGSALKLSLALIIAGMGITASATGAIVHGRNPWAIKLTGTVTDTACGTTTHEALVPGDALCVRTCVEVGANYALATDTAVYVLSGHRPELYKYAGEKVQIKGQRVGWDIILVESVVPLVAETSRGVN